MAARTRSGSIARVEGLSTQPAVKSGDIAGTIKGPFASGVTAALGNPVKSAATQSLRTSVRTSSSLTSKGLSASRPEVVSAVDFVSVGADDPTQLERTASRSLAVHHAARALVSSNIESLIVGLSQDNEAAEALESLEDALSTQLADIRARALLVSQGLAVLDLASKSLDPIASDSNVAGRVRTMQESRDGATTGPVGFIELMVARGYSASHVREFSGTKVLASLLTDAALLVSQERDSVPRGRSSDNSVTGLTATNAMRRSGVSTSELAAMPVTSLAVGSVITGLGTDPIAVAARAVWALSKELRLSVSLSAPATRVLIRDVIGSDVSQAELAEAIFGTFEDSVTRVPDRFSRFSSALYARDSDANRVMTFERRSIQDGTRTLIPGSIHLVDSVVSSQVGEFNTTRLTNFAVTAVDDFSAGRNLVRKLMMFDSSGTNLDSRGIADLCISSLATSVRGISTVGVVSQRAALCAGVLAACASAPELRAAVLRLIVERAQDSVGSAVPAVSRPSSRVKTVTNTSVQPTQARAGTVRADTSARHQREQSSAVSLGGEEITAAGVSAVTQSLTAQKIRDEIESLYGTQSQQMNIRPPKLSSFVGGQSSRDIVTIALDSVPTLLLGDDATTSAIDGIVEVVTVLCAEATRRQGSLGFMPDMSGIRRTTYSGVDMSGLCLLVMQAFTGIIASQVTCSMSANNKKSIVVSVDTESNAKFVAASGQLFGRSGAVSAAELRLTNSLATLTALRSSASANDDFLVSFTDHVVALAEEVKAAAGTVAAFFGVSRGDPNAVGLVDLAKAFGPALSTVFSRGQAGLVAAYLDSVRSMGGPSGVIRCPSLDAFVSDSATPGVVRAACAEKDVFGGSSSSVKILSVGLPSGFVRSLTSTFVVGETKKYRVPEEGDVVRVSVYRKSYEFEDLVFKPQVFLFDSSKFIRPSSLTGDSVLGAGLAEIADSLAEFVDTSPQSSLVTMTGRDIAASNDYGFMTAAEREEIPFNHVVSHVCWLYMRLLAGIDTSEATFRMGSAVTTDSDAAIASASGALLDRLLDMAGSSYAAASALAVAKASPSLASVMAGHSLGQPAARSRRKGTSRVAGDPGALKADMLTFARVFATGDYLGGVSGVASRISQPKAFERVFHIPVDMSAFEVDTEATAESVAGRTMLDSRDFQVVKLSPTSGGVFIDADVELDDVFVTVEPAFEA